MASKPEDRKPPELTIPRDAFAAELKTRIAKGNGLLTPRSQSDESLASFQSQFNTWDEYNKELLRKRFTTSEISNEYAYAGGTRVTGLHRTIAQEMRMLSDYMREKVRFLNSVLDRLPLYEQNTPAASPEKGAMQPNGGGDTIFVVHGHERGLQQQVIRFIEQVTEYKCVSLGEQVKQSRTIIEAFEKHASSAAFAVVLITGDDEGRKVGDAGFSRRPRQNVVFELGYFFGALGRSRVAALYEPEVEVPSDISGVLYTQLDERDGWKLELAKELKAAGVSVDVNRAV